MRVRARGESQGEIKMRGPASTKAVTSGLTVNQVGTKKVSFIQPKNLKPLQSGAARVAIPCMTQPIEVGGNVIGGTTLSWVVGPAFVESSGQMLTVGQNLQDLGIKFLRAGVTVPEKAGDNFRGLGVVGLKLLRATADRFQLQVVTEVLEVRDIPLVAEYADVIEVCPKNINNVALLAELAFLEKTIVLHRSPMMTFDEYIGMLPYLEKGGRAKIVLADNGVVSFDGRLNRMLDLSSLISLKRETGYPVLVDCCAAASDWSFAERLAIAAIAAGADGIMAELHLPGGVAEASKKSLVKDELASLMWKSKALKSTLNALLHGDPQHAPIKPSNRAANEI